MAVYDWSKIMGNKKDYELKEIINRPEFRPQESIECAKKEIEKRQLVKQQNEDGQSDSEFPDKPEINKQTNIVKKSILSLGLFIAAFYLIFRWEIGFILILVAVIFIHEMGHYLAMRIFKYKDLSIYFIPLLGAIASGDKDQISQKQKTIVLFSGPIPGIIIGLVLYYFGLNHGSQILIQTSNILIFLNLFNLLPIYPLDGGQLIKNFFFNSKEKIYIIFISLSILGLGFIAIKSGSYILLIIPFLLFNQLITQSKVNKTKDDLILKGFDLNKNYEELTNEEYWKIRDQLGIHLKAMRYIIEPKRYVISNREKLVTNQIKSIVQKEPIRDIKTGGKILSILIWILCFILPIVIIYNISLG